MWFVELLFTLEENQTGSSLGRADQDLYPLYRHGIDNGAITEAEASELLCCWLIHVFRGRGTAALTAMGRASTASSDRLHLRKTLSGGASGGTQGLSRGPGHGGIDLAACPERVSLCWNTLKFLQGRKNVGSLQKRFPSLPQYCLKP